MRIKNGHPAPYNLKFIERGNENYNIYESDQSYQYPERYYKFYSAIKEKYPDIVIPQRSLDHTEIVTKLNIDVFVVGDDWTGKYDYLKYELPEMVTYWGEWVAKPQAYMHGTHDFPGSNYHIGFQVFTKSSPMEVPHFHVGAEEYMVFVGPGFPNIFDYDATITMFIGKDPDNMEKIVVDKPCVHLAVSCDKAREIALAQNRRALQQVQ